MAQIKKGIGASSGVAISKVYLLEPLHFHITNQTVKDVAAELSKINRAVSLTVKQIDEILVLSEQKIGIEKAIVFQAHKQIVTDPDLTEQISNKVNNEKLNGGFVINEIYDQTIKLFESMQDEYFKQRASDVYDVKERLLANYYGLKLPDILTIDKEVIIVANDLTPSQTALLNKKYVKGFLTNIGGRTSHAAIMARTLGIPAILGLENITDLVKQGDTIAMDGTKGVFEINPIDLTEWNQLVVKYQKELTILKQYATFDPITLDKHKVCVEANIGHPNDCKNLASMKIDGIGLFRSEFLYMDNQHWPTLEEQFEAYKTVIESQKNKMVIVRTLDIGGDKKLNYYQFDHEDNPFLGHRAIRFCLSHKDIFKTQLKALLKASVYGQLGIMFPMIATIDELKEAKKVLNEVKMECDQEKIVYAKNLKVGIMVEIPAVAINAELFAKHVDFFSIGTNDLIQYSLAADRMSPTVSYLYQPNNPSILKAIQNVIAAGAKYNIHVGMCGEMASNVESIPLLLGLYNKGLDAFSMTASAIPKAKYIICNIKHSDCIKLAQKALTLESQKEVNALVAEFFQKNNLN